MAGRLNDLGTRGGEVVNLDPRIIVIRKNWNYRDLESPGVKAHIDWLKTNIRDRGVQQPVRVEYVDGKAFLVDGQCRVEACKQLWTDGVKVPYKGGGEGPPVVPCLTVKGDEAEMLAASMVANGSLPPSQLEFGAAASRLSAYGWPEEKIALYTPPHIAQDGTKARRYVKEAIELHEAPIAVKRAVTEGVDGVAVSPALALQAARKSPLHAEEEIRKVAAEAKAKGKKAAKRPKGEGVAAKAKKQAKDATDDLLRIGDELATMILDEKVSYDLVRKQAKVWQRKRGQ